MFIHFDGLANAGCANCANCANPCMHCRRYPSPSGSGICANCPTPFCLRNTGPYNGTKEFPVAAARAGALLLRLAGHSNRRRGSGNCGNPAIGDNGRHCHNNFTHYPRIGNLRLFAASTSLNNCNIKIKGPKGSLFHVAYAASY
jgi:hypothetical protein